MKQQNNPHCRMCGALVESEQRQADAERIAKRCNEKGNPYTGEPWTTPVRPSYFCSDECIRAKYIG